LGRDIKASLVRDLMSHSVNGFARYATTLGTRASCSWITAVPDVHSAASLAFIGKKNKEVSRHILEVINGLEQAT
jgi:hypothetical protein